MTDGNQITFLCATSRAARKPVGDLDFGQIVVAFADVCGWTIEQIGQLNREQVAILFDEFKRRRAKDK